MVLMLRCKAEGCDGDAYDVPCNCHLGGHHGYCKEHLEENGWTRGDGCWHHPVLDAVIRRLDWDRSDPHVTRICHRMSGIQGTARSANNRSVYNVVWFYGLAPPESTAQVVQVVEMLPGYLKTVLPAAGPFIVSEFEEGAIPTFKSAGKD